MPRRILAFYRQLDTARRVVTGWLPRCCPLSELGNEVSPGHTQHHLPNAVGPVRLRSPQATGGVVRIPCYALQ